MKFRQVGEDGYIWYMLKRGNLFGARDLEGNNIIPIQYSSVSYHCDDRFGVHCFYVKSGDFEGACQTCLGLGTTASGPLFW